MKVIRFVTESEMELYLSGAEIMNATHHSDYSKATSIGNCFAEVTESRDADKWLRKLLFIRPCKWCIEFDTDKFQTPLQESEAVYTGDSAYEI